MTAISLECQAHNTSIRTDITPAAHMNTSAPQVSRALITTGINSSTANISLKHLKYNARALIDLPTSNLNNLIHPEQQ